MSTWTRRALFVSAVVGIALAGLLLASIFGCGCSSPSVAATLNVLPFPGTPDASPHSQIAFPALAPADITTLTIRGSLSGQHPGQLTSLPNGRGTAFVPVDPFTPGERVTVHAAFRTSAAGTVSGAPDATNIAFAFTVAIPPPGTTTATSPTAAASGPPAPEPATWSFHSRPDLHPPVVTVSMPDADPGAGYVFVDAQRAPQAGPMILDGSGNVVWFDPLPAGESAVNLQVQSYQGQRVLTWWRGLIVPSGYGLGEDVIVNGLYQPVAIVHAGEGYLADAHDFLITPEDTALLPVYQQVQADLTFLGESANSSVLDSIIQEVDIKTGRLLWEWHALGHVPLSASYAAKPTGGAPYDFFHINSIQETRDGNLIVSARNTWAVYKINRSTGAIMWQVGGKQCSFQMGPGTQFAWQHDARLQADGTLTLFDNADVPNMETQSRALRIALDTQNMTASPVSGYTHDPSLTAGSQGNVQVLPSGNSFVGWGDQPNFSEFTATGRMIFDVKFPGQVQSYRAYRFLWVGQPKDPPSLSVSSESDGLTAYVSWNGATDVARWQLLAGPSSTSLSPVAEAPATGFETAISTSISYPYLAVRALDASGRLLGTSVVVSH